MPPPHRRRLLRESALARTRKISAFLLSDRKALQTPPIYFRTAGQFVGNRFPRMFPAIAECFGVTQLFYSLIRRLVWLIAAGPLALDAASARNLPTAIGGQILNHWRFASSSARSGSFATIYFTSVLATGTGESSQAQGTIRRKSGRQAKQPGVCGSRSAIVISRLRMELRIHGRPGSRYADRQAGSVIGILQNSREMFLRPTRRPRHVGISRSQSSWTARPRPAFASSLAPVWTEHEFDRLFRHRTQLGAPGDTPIRDISQLPLLL